MNMTPQNPEHLAFLFQVEYRSLIWCSSTKPFLLLVCFRTLHAGDHRGADQPADCDDVRHLPENSGKQP